METRLGIQQTLEPALTIVILVLFSLGNGVYVQEHMNRAWGVAASRVPAPPPMPLTPNMA